MAEASREAACVEGTGAVTPAVVGQHAADLDAEMLVVGERGGEKRGGAGGRLVGVDLGEGHAGMVIHADMDVFPAGAWTGVAAVVGNAVAGAAKPAEFLDIEVQQVAGMRMFVAANGRRRPGPGRILLSEVSEISVFLVWLFKQSIPEWLFWCFDKMGMGDHVKWLLTRPILSLVFEEGEHSPFFRSQAKFGTTANPKYNYTRRLFCVGVKNSGRTQASDVRVVVESVVVTTSPPF